MVKKRVRTPGLLDILFSILVEPRGTTYRLLASEPYPPKVLTTFTLFIALCIAPPLLNLRDLSELQDRLPMIAITLSTTILTLSLTSFFSFMGLRALNSYTSPFQIIASIAYATTPFITLLSVLWCTNQILEGDLTAVNFIATGLASSGDLAIAVLPTSLRIAAGLALIIMTCCYRHLVGASLSVGLLLAVATVPLLLGSFIVSASIFDLIAPYSSANTIRFFSGFLGR